MKSKINVIQQAVAQFVRALLSNYINSFRVDKSIDCFALTIKRIAIVCKTLRIYNVCFSMKPKRIRDEFLTLLLYKLKEFGYELKVNERGYFVFCKANTLTSMNRNY